MIRLKKANPSIWQSSITAAAMGACISMSCSSAVAGDVPDSGAEAATKPDRPRLQQPADRGTAASTAMKAHVDPKTGKLGPPPADSPVQTVEPAFSRSSDELTIVDSPVGQGKMVDLKGRFRNPLTATLNKNGTLSIGHGEPPAAAQPKQSDR